MHLFINISSGGCVAVPCGAFLEPEKHKFIKIAGLSAAAGLLAGHRDPITGPLGGKLSHPWAYHQPNSLAGLPGLLACWLAG